MRTILMSSQPCRWQLAARGQSAHHRPRTAAASPQQAAHRHCATAKRITTCTALRNIQQCQQYDVLELVQSSSSSSSSSSSQLPEVTQEYVQVVQGWDGTSAIVLRKGQLVRLAYAAESDPAVLLPSYVGQALAADSPTVTRFPALKSVLSAMPQPGDPLENFDSAEVVDSLELLQQRVTADPAPWRDGLVPGDPVKPELEQAVFTACELIAFLQGQRGLVLVQLFNGFDRAQGQPFFQPLALHMFEQALAAPGVACIGSVASGGSGLTAILYADREPFASYAAHLASFGCQANLVAGSEYYVLLIGRLLGYKQENVLGYVATRWGKPASPELVAQVEADIRKLSKVQPKLPWDPADATARKPKRPKAATSKAGGSGGFGKKTSAKR